MPGVISPGDSRTVGELAALKWEYAEGRPELHTAVKLAMGGILQVTTRPDSAHPHALRLTPLTLLPSGPAEPHHRDRVARLPVVVRPRDHGAARIALWVSDLFNTTSSELRPAAVALAEARRGWRRARRRGGGRGGGGGRRGGGHRCATAAVAAADVRHRDPTVGCPVRVANATLESATDATPPSPPQPPPPPSPPSPPRSRASLRIECDFVPCETLSDDEWAEMERNAESGAAGAGGGGFGATAVALAVAGVGTAWRR